MGRGGPREPELVESAPSLDELVRIARDGRHAASDYLEDAVLAGVPAVGCRRVGGGLAGEPSESNVTEGAALAASLEPRALVFEGSGACVPPVEVDGTVCLVGNRAGALETLGSYRLLRADLALVLDSAAAGTLEEVAALCPGETMPFALRPEPAEEVPGDARVALFTTGAGGCGGLEPVVTSRNLARRAALVEDLDRAAAERCDLYLTELKAAAIDTVVARSRREGARVIFVRNRPVGLDADLDEALVKLYEECARRSS
jgi:cyclic 2,3-diphosphoglycerate synthase